MGTYANSKDQDEMLRKAALHHGPHCLLEENNQVQEKNTVQFGNFNLFSIDMYLYNKPYEVYCIESDGRPHVTKEKFNRMESL